VRPEEAPGLDYLALLTEATSRIHRVSTGIAPQTKDSFSGRPFRMRLDQIRKAWSAYSRSCAIRSLARFRIGPKTTPTPAAALIAPLRPGRNEIKA
jgi:hypothetical protein